VIALDNKPIRLNMKEINKIKNFFIKKHYKKDEVIFFEDEIGQELFLIEKGKVKIVKITKNGEELILNIFCHHEIFAGIVMFDNGPYPATAIAMEDSIINKIKTNNLKTLISKYPDITIKIMKIIAERIRRAQQNQRNLGLKNAKEKVASLLNYLAERYGEKKGNKIKIDIKITQEEIADMTGTTRETISRTINLFKKEGYIETSKKNIYILDIQKLKEKM
jgi:CRP/FNR family transcriptional regulator, cyclic AMP receptor protein